MSEPNSAELWAVDPRPCPLCWSPDSVGCPHGENKMACDCRPSGGFAEIHPECDEELQNYREFLQRIEGREVSGVELIAAERQRQIEKEDYDSDHDDGHTLGELAAAAACYALLGTKWRDADVLHSRLLRNLWPWGWADFKPADYGEPPYGPRINAERRVKDLVRAGALIAAEIDRLKRLK